MLEKKSPLRVAFLCLPHKLSHKKSADNKTLCSSFMGQTNQRETKIAPNSKTVNVLLELPDDVSENSQLTDDFH